MNASSSARAERSGRGARRPPSTQSAQAGPGRERRSASGRDRVRPSGVVRGMAALLSLLVSAVLVGALLVLVLARTSAYTSDPQVLISPGGDLDATEVTSFYEALSRGQITATAAAIVGEPTVRRDAADQAGVDSSQVAVTVSVVPETTLVRIAVSAPTAEDAEAVARVIVDVAVDEIQDLLPAFDVTPLSQEVPRATASGVTTTQVVAAAAVTGVVAFTALYLSLLSLWRARHRRLT